MRTPIDGGRLIAGRYALKGVIGRGGMSSVYRGRDEVLERDVALKPLGLLPGQDAPDLRRAEREARLAARLDHAHVVAVFDLLEDDGVQWLVMEHVNGRNLAQLVAEHGPLPPDSAARLLGQAADALAAAHDAGIVHRDVKPSNMLVTPEGQVKLTDFGIARAYSDPTLTATGIMTGSPAYLAPEIASGRPATTASDVWALGATLYHALTGEPPYDARDNVMGALYRIVNDEPPRPADAGWLAPVLEHTMAKDPGDRWPMDEVRDRLVRRNGDAPTRPLTSFTPTKDHPTVRTTAVATSAAAPATELGPPPSVLSFTETSRAPDRPRRGRPSAVLLGALALLVVALLAGVVLLTGLGDDASDTTATGTSGETTAPSTPDSTPEDTPEQDPTPQERVEEPVPDDTPTQEPEQEPEQEPTEQPSEEPTEQPAEQPDQAPAGSEAAMQDFVSSYFATVTRDPATTWAQLTPEFQASVGSYDRYRAYWSTIADVQATGIDADPDELTATFTMVSRRTDGSVVDEAVTLLLQPTEDGYLIAGQS